MCTYNLEIAENIVSRVRPSFKDDRALKDWMQQQIIKLMLHYDAKPQHSTAPARISREEALEFVKSLAVCGGENVPADISAIECLVSEKYV